MERVNTNMSLSLNRDFVDWVTSLKKEIRCAQLKAATRVNSELLHLYWHMGEEICEKQKTATWGDGWLKELSRELTAEFPNMSGFSHRNLKYIRQWYQFYEQVDAIGQQLVAQLEKVFFSVPWGHHIYKISHCKSIDEAAFFLPLAASALFISPFGARNTSQTTTNN